MEVNARWADQGLIVVKPHVPTKTSPGDPYGDACAIAEFDWQGEHGAKSIAWDTLTWRSKVLLQMAAEAKQYGENIQFGKTGRRHVMPQKGDYGAAQSMCLEIRNLLAAQPLHLIIAGHTQIAEFEDDNTGAKTAAAGFGLVGKASVMTFADMFDQYVRLFVDQKRPLRSGEQGYRKVMMQLQRGRLFDAGLRVAHELPEAVEIPFSLEGQREVWRQLMGWAAVDRGALLRMGIYSAPNVGKSMFITAVPDELKPLVYVADDPGSEFLRSTWDELLEGGEQK